MAQHDRPEGQSTHGDAEQSRAVQVRAGEIKPSQIEQGRAWLANGSSQGPGAEADQKTKAGEGIILQGTAAQGAILQRLHLEPYLVPAMYLHVDYTLFQALQHMHDATYVLSHWC